MHQTDNRSFYLVPFHQDMLTAFDIDGECHVALRPICDAIGVDWSAQRKRIMRDAILSTCVVITATQVPGESQKRDVMAIPISHLNGFLFGINAKRVNETVKPALIRYQQESYKALHDYWIEGKAANPRKISGPSFPSTSDLIRLVDRIERERQPAVRSMLHQHLTKICDQLEISVASLDAIGQAAPSITEFCEPFFRGLSALDSKIVKWDWHRRSDLAAVNMPQMIKLFEKHDVDCLIGADMRIALRQHPAFVDFRNVNGTDDKVRVCWIFRRDRMKAKTELLS